MSLTKEEILAIEDRDIIEVRVPQWKGKTVYVRTLTGAEAEKLFRAARSQPGRPPAEDDVFVIRLVSCCLCDAGGTPLFHGNGDTQALGRKNWAALRVVFDAACKLNGIGEEAEKELGKPSEPTTESASGSG